MKYRKLFIREVKTTVYTGTTVWFSYILPYQTQTFGVLTNVWNLYVAFDYWTISDVIRQVLLMI